MEVGSLLGAKCVCMHVWPRLARLLGVPSSSTSPDSSWTKVAGSAF